jgi:hypothetical protein
MLYHNWLQLSILLTMVLLALAVIKLSQMRCMMQHRLDKTLTWTIVSKLKAILDLSLPIRIWLLVFPKLVINSLLQFLNVRFDWWVYIISFILSTIVLIMVMVAPAPFIVQLKLNHKLVLERPYYYKY